MSNSVEAVYERGVLRPLQPLEGIAENARAWLKVELTGETTHPLTECIGILPDEDAKERRRVIDAEFEQVEPDAWR
jgi:predicted DNA-binding antitoxin AbrB/MazE fold protein